MSTLFQTTDIHSAREARCRLAEQIRQLPYKITPVGTPLSVLRFEFFIEPVDILAWLHNQKVQKRMYWSDRQGGFEIGGIGIADIVEANGPNRCREVFEHMEARLSADNTNSRYYGGMAFQGGPCAEEWRDFGECRFIIPRFEILKNEKGCVFAFNIALKDIAEETVKGILLELETIDFSLSTEYRTPPRVQTRQDLPDREEWDSIFRAITDKTGKLIYDKIVLARQSVFRFDKYIDPIALIKHLKDRSPNCFHFCFQTDKTTAFLGASPERLYKRIGGKMASEAVAGTSARGASREEETILEKKLLSCSKNALEHRYVVDAIREALGELCEEVRTDTKPRLVKLEGGQHLVTNFDGALRPGVCDDEIVGRLHPTPAVAGYPREEALRAIKEIEPFSRGWYAGPIGYVGWDRCEFAVAIRSALVNHNTLSIYAGAGIVEGSTAEGEWREIETKIWNFIEVFNKK